MTRTLLADMAAQLPALIVWLAVFGPVVFVMLAVGGM
jgi:hypothetical protein